MSKEQPILPHHEKLRLIKLGLLPKECVPKPKKYLNRISPKRKAENQALMEIRGEKPMDLFFENMRKKMVGVCQCGCARKSSKNEDDHYRASICHIFPKRTFKSIATNEYNWVERNFWDGCHSNMDNRSMDLWPMYADWQDIRERFFILSTLLTEDERKHKFYQHLEKLVYA